MATATAPRVLTAAEITAKMASAGGRKRNVHPPFMRSFIASGKSYTIANEHPSYMHYSFDELKTKVQGLKAAYKTLRVNNMAAGIQDTPEIEVVFIDNPEDEDHGKLYVINMTVVNAERQAAASTNNGNS